MKSGSIKPCVFKSISYNSYSLSVCSQKCQHFTVSSLVTKHCNLFWHPFTVCFPCCFILPQNNKSHLRPLTLCRWFKCFTNWVWTGEKWMRPTGNWGVAFWGSMFSSWTLWIIINGVDFEYDLEFLFVSNGVVLRVKHYGVTWSLSFQICVPGSNFHVCSTEKTVMFVQQTETWISEAL